MITTLWQALVSLTGAIPHGRSQGDTSWAREMPSSADCENQESTVLSVFMESRDLSVHTIYERDTTG